ALGERDRRVEVGERRLALADREIVAATPFEGCGAIGGLQSIAGERLRIDLDRAVPGGGEARRGLELGEVDRVRGGPRRGRGEEGQKGGFGAAHQSLAPRGTLAEVPAS